MTIYGGFYHEKCIIPKWDQVYGSAGRAAAILSNFTSKITLNTFSSNIEYLEFFSNAYKINYVCNPSIINIKFEYFHTFSKANIICNKNNFDRYPSVKIEDSVVICYGTIEANAPIIKAEYGIFDFQSSTFNELFNEENCIDNIAIILNYEEAKYISSECIINDIKEYFFNTVKNLKVLIIKDGPFGGYVCSPDKVNNIPIYKNKFIFKIGTGDIFTCLFGYFWANKKINNLELEKIIDYASFGTAFYTENYKSQYKNNFLNFYESNTFERLLPNRNNFKNKVYLAGPFFNASQRWQIEDTKQQLEKLNFNVFSPIHDVGIGKSKEIAQKDLKGLDESDSVFAILNGYDPGTVFEIGYAIAKNKKVIALYEQNDEINLTMFHGSDCMIFNDITTALYNLVWTMTSK